MIVAYERVKTKTWIEHNSSVMKMLIFNMDNDREALDFLIMNKVILPRDPGDVILPIVDKWERGIVDSLEYLVSVYAAHEKVWSVPSIDSSYKTFSGHPLCDEQQKAFHMIMNNPITVIDGKAGAGKTDLLFPLHEIYAPDEIIACAWQGTNIARLAEMFPDSARTVHMTLYEHYNSCPRSPSRKDKKIGEAHCRFEKCRILVIDEGTFVLVFFFSFY